MYVSLGDADQAMTWLEEGYQKRFNPGVLLRPGFDPLRSDPRFRDLVHRFSLPGDNRSKSRMAEHLIYWHSALWCTE
jgi:hypothetical protein